MIAVHSQFMLQQDIARVLVERMSNAYIYQGRENVTPELSAKLVSLDPD
ncbi:hypothetical protein IVB25_29335 [Bradyrhizobium sp. 193]|nr:hypothetical protein [Bradyrhizobium sp. 193]MCK1486683.1 hypothetical protein [Bradyrhizobium sp. 193]